MVRVKEKEPKYQIFPVYVRDVFKHIDQVTADNTGIPIFMFGHSVGGTIAVLSVTERRYFFAGAIFSAPSIKVEANPCTVCVGRIVSWITPSYQIRPPIDPSLLSQDPTQVYKNGRHELLNEVEETASVVYKDILDWIQQKLP